MEDYSEDVRPEDFNEISTELAIENEVERPSRLPQEHNHLVAGIVITALFSVFGLPTLINACKSLLRWRHGNYEPALQAAKKAKRWKFWGIFLGIIFTIAWTAFYLYFMFGADGNPFEFNDYANPTFNY